MPLSFLFDSLTSAVLRGSSGDAEQHRACKGGPKAPSRREEVSTRFIGTIQFGANFPAAFQRKASFVFTSRLGSRWCKSADHRRTRVRVATQTTPRGLLFSRLISSSLLIPILLPCYVVPLPPFMFRLELDRTQLYFTAFQPPSLRWSTISPSRTKNPGTFSTTGTYCFPHTPPLQTGFSCHCWQLSADVLAEV